jgi:hypothetical protein
MKKLYLIWIALSVISYACQKSQFSTTTRQNKKGKVTYVNHYPKEKTKSSKGMAWRSLVKEAEAQKKTGTLGRNGVRNIPESRITAIPPAPLFENSNLIASTSGEPVVLAADENRVFYTLPDTTKSSAHPRETKMDSVTLQVIKFRKGNKDTVTIISQSHDTLKYEVLSEKGIVRSVRMDKVDTIFQVTIINPYGQAGGRAARHQPVVEPFGLASSILPVFGMFPVWGFPFALLGLIFGIVSLTRYNRFPGRFKRKGIAINGIVWGVLGTLFSGILILVFLLG